MRPHTDLGLPCSKVHIGATGEQGVALCYPGGPAQAAVKTSIGVSVQSTSETVETGDTVLEPQGKFFI